MQRGVIRRVLKPGVMPIGILVILAATILGLILIKKIRPRTMLLVPAILILSSVNELLVYYCLKSSQKIIAYNIFSLIEILLWSLFFIFSVYHKQKTNSIAIVLGLFFVSVAEIYALPGFHSVSYRVFSLYAIITAAVYFISLIRIKEVHSLSKDSHFWIFLGLIIFHTVFIFYLTALDFKEFRSDTDAVLAFRQILNIINIGYYALISIGIICSSFYRL